MENYKKDSDLLLDQYKKYKDKNGKKAKNLKSKIENFIAFEKLIDDIKSKT